MSEDLRHERRVGLKVLHPELAAVVGAERLLAEIKTTAGLHPELQQLRLVENFFGLIEARLAARS